MTIQDPFCFYPGDFTLFYAVTTELMVRKLLVENGYNQKEFGTHIDMTAALDGKSGFYPWENVETAIQFIVEALTFMGCRIRWKVAEGDYQGTMIAVRLPEMIGCLNDNRVELLRLLNYGRFDSYYEVKLGKRNTVFYLFDEFGSDWRCLVNIIEGIMELYKGGLTYGGSSDNAA